MRPWLKLADIPIQKNGYALGVPHTVLRVSERPPARLALVALGNERLDLLLVEAIVLCGRTLLTLVAAAADDLVVFFTTKDTYGLFLRLHVDSLDQLVSIVKENL
jgi:hypothetical protein